ncbi:MAG: hypothetical protein K0R67_2725 [Paenibacillus sp.]|nr:hypothetical protein [Paenibacillus sp.]
MNNRELWNVDDSILLYPLEMKQVQSDSNWRMERQFLRSHLLLIIIQGSGTLELDGKKGPLRSGKSYVLVPGMLASVVFDQSDPAALYSLSFDILKPSSAAGSEDTGEDQALFRRGKLSMSYSGELESRNFQEVVHLARLLCEQAQHPADWRPFRHQLLVHELLHAVFDQVEEESDSRHAIERTAEYIHSRFAEEMTRVSLAGVAGMSEWYFAHLFKKWMGRSPMDYLNDVRMNKAKEKLLLSTSRVRDIAHEVGFADEFYFSRRFKKTVGITPSDYQRQKRNKIASISFPYAGHLLALDIMPYATFVDRQRDRHRQSFFQHIPYHLKRSKEMAPELWEENLNELLQAGPEIILCDDYAQSVGFEQMKKIAPTVVIPWMQHDWRVHFKLIAMLLGMEKEARLWLDAYDHKAEHAAQLLRRTIGNETVSIVHIMLGTIVVYGRRNGGAVLYGDLGLRPGYNIEAIEVLREIDAEDLPAYAGDHLFMIVDADAASSQRWARLKESVMWKGLKSVQRHKLYVLSESPWLDYSPYAHNLVIDAAVSLLCGQSNSTCV